MSTWTSANRDFQGWVEQTAYAQVRLPGTLGGGVLKGRDTFPCALNALLPPLPTLEARARSVRSKKGAQDQKSFCFTLNKNLKISIFLSNHFLSCMEGSL